MKPPVLILSSLVVPLSNVIAAINDLGPAGQSYTRASLSFANGHAFAHTIRELICIGK